LSAPNAVAAIPIRRPAVALRPSEYTAALIQALRAEPAAVQGADVLEIGSGSGVVLAAMGALGATSLCGIDIEKEAVTAGSLLLRQLGFGALAEFHQGDMWHPVADRRFDLIVANLPQFPMAPAAIGGRLPSWSSGGADGRAVLDPFLEGVATHLVPDGRAVITHNAFIDLDSSRRIAGRNGLALRVLQTSSIAIPTEKLERLTEAVLRKEEGRTIHRYGADAFADMHVVEIVPAASVV